jgi:hypothetical protein
MFYKLIKHFIEVTFSAKSFYFLILLLYLCFPNLNNAQNLPDNARFKTSVIKLNRFLTSLSFYKIRLNEGELAGIDSLFTKSIELNAHDTSEALLALTFALLPFREMNLKTPIVNNNIRLFLPTLTEPEFKNRLESLPKNFLADSPLEKYNDTDKLSHFFGNAFLGYNLNFFNLIEFLGIFVESFELTFKIDGAFDRRDLAINKYGDLFGKLLASGKKVFPSDIINIYSLKFLRIQ